MCHGVFGGGLLHHGKLWPYLSWVGLRGRVITFCSHHGWYDDLNPYNPDTDLCNSLKIGHLLSPGQF